ncbi:MAG: hypothetical protein J5680_07040 [Neisseriaceae bacterium]|nr:hypothetical protein [Neisseriaceae bacterium]
MRIHLFFPLSKVEKSVSGSLKQYSAIILCSAVTVGWEAHPTTKPAAWRWVENPPYGVSVFFRLPETLYTQALRLVWWVRNPPYDCVGNKLPTLRKKTVE